jgi:molecular chaperone GrpE
MSDDVKNVENKDTTEIIAEEPVEAEPPDPVSILKNELAETQAKANEYLDGWQRARADFSNYKKRVEREQSQIYQNAAGSILKRYLGIVDDLERALKNRPQDGDGAAWAEGIELIYRKLLSILESEGIQPMEAEGQPFDPNLHEAIMSEESDEHESGQIIEVLQQGYMLGDKVLRPAMVRVAR